MTAITAHTLKPRHALPHFACVIGEGDWPAERIESTLRDGQFYALGPKDMPAKYLTRFKGGGILPSGRGESDGKNWIVPVPNLDNDFASLVVKKASEIAGLKLFFREPYLKLTDKSKFVEGLEQIDSALYSRIEHCDITNSSVVDAINARSVSWNFFMIGTKAFTETLSFSNLITHAEMIAVNAYDGESYLFWTRARYPK